MTLDDAREGMTALAQSMAPSRAAREGFCLYEKFRPEIAGGVKGWGAAGRLDLDGIRAMAKSDGG